MVATIGTVIDSLNWLTFWQNFHDYALWDLEWFDGTNWISVKSDLTINKKYPAENQCKFSLIFKASQAGSFRLTFAVNRKVSRYFTKIDKFQYDLEYEDAIITFDWSDCKNISGLQFTHGVKDDYFWFRIRRDNVPQGAQLEIDPSIVGTSTSTIPVIYGFQKKCFYANGRWWVFYYNGTYFGWRTSTDGSTWSDWTSYNTGLGSDEQKGWRFDIWYDEPNNKICLARCKATVANVYYRQGTANSDGTITWDSAEVLIITDAGYDIKLCKDSNGYPWVSYLQSVTGYPLRVVQATATNGSSWGSPTTLWTPASGSSDIIIVPLTGGKMLAIRSLAGSVFQSRLYTGSTWELAVNASTSTPSSNSYFDAVADGDNVHLVFVKVTSVDLIYVKYVYGTGWGSEETVESATVAQYHPSITFKSSDKVRVFYLLTQTTIKYRDRDSGSWQTAVTISSSESTMTCVCSSYQAFSSKICVTWKSGASSPYDVKFEGYTLAIVKEVTDSLSLSDAVLRNKTLAISDSVGLVDTLLRDKVFQILDELNLTDIIFRDKTFTITDSISLSEIIEVITGAIIKYVADAIGLTEQIKVDKAFIVSDTLNLLDQVFRHRPSVTITDAIVLAETIAAAKTLAITDQIALSDMALILKQLRVIDAINLADAVSTPSRILHALDSIGLSDNAFVNKILIVSDQIALAEIVEKTVAGGVKTRIFLVLGDLAIQVCGG